MSDNERDTPVEVLVRNFYVVAVPPVERGEGYTGPTIQLIESHRTADHARKAANRMRFDLGYQDVFVDAGLRLHWDYTRRMYRAPDQFEVVELYNRPRRK